MNNVIRILFLSAGLYFVVNGHLILALICFAITIGLEFLFSLGLLIVVGAAILLLAGCGSFVKTEYIYVDNSAVNNYVGNPCGFYLGDRCLVWKDGRLARNPDNPYRGNK